MRALVFAANIINFNSPVLFHASVGNDVARISPRYTQNGGCKSAVTL